ncbi:MAG: hypothetical protein U0931_11390 [Vulcanimicrobiota bacterium]
MKKIAFAIPLILTAAGWAQPKPERDPFVNLGAAAPVIQESEPHQSRPEILTRVHQPNSLPQTKSSSPRLRVLGLLTHSSQPRAIVAGEKQTCIVAQGDSLGQYRVARIDRSGITLAYKQTHFHCPISQ